MRAIQPLTADDIEQYRSRTIEFCDRLKITLERLAEDAKLRDSLQRLLDSQPPIAVEPLPVLEIENTPATSPAPPALKGKALPATGSPRKRAKPQVGLDPNRVLEILPTSEDKALSVASLAGMLNETGDRVRYAMKRLKADRLVKMTGATASARWYKQPKKKSKA